MRAAALHWDRIVALYAFSSSNDVAVSEITFGKSVGKLLQLFVGDLVDAFCRERNGFGQSMIRTQPRDALSFLFTGRSLNAQLTHACAQCVGMQAQDQSRALRPLDPPIRLTQNFVNSFAIEFLQG